MTHGRLVEWMKKEGDPIAEGDCIATVETDKATMEINASLDGYMARILVEPDTPDIPLGQLIAITVEEEADIAAFANFTSDAVAGTITSPVSAATAKPAPTPLAAPKPDLPEHNRLILPKVSPTMTHGRLVEWMKEEGAAIAEGDCIATVETDKATMEINASLDGFMARILVDPDTPNIPLGQLIAITVEEKEHIAAFANLTAEELSPSAASAAPNTPPGPARLPTPADSAVEAPIPTAASVPASPTTPYPPTKYTGQMSPALARLLNEYPNLDLNSVIATGPKGNVLKGDVIAAIENGTAFGRSPSVMLTQVPDSDTPAAAQTAVIPVIDQVSSGYTDVPVTSMRRAIARRLTQSKTTVPHQYATSTFELDSLLALRKRLNAADPSPAVSVNDFVIRAIGIALRRVPEMNVHWDEATQSAIPNTSVDISFAVAIPGGLITPIVKSADSIGLGALAADTKRLVGLARNGKLTPHEYEGGSFSVSNLGMYGISNFKAIINPPQSGNLAIGSGIARAIVDSETGDIRKAIVGTATVSTDARVVSDVTATAFLREFTSCLSNPESMLM
jgi:pyruvate dehydrogenase E2 component (dihydrolipoamide acetyltransferase)